MRFKLKFWQFKDGHKLLVSEEFMTIDEANEKLEKMLSNAMNEFEYTYTVEL